MFIHILIRSFWVLYDNLFKFILLNFIFFLGCLGIFALFFMKMSNELLAGGLILLFWHLVAPAYMHLMGKIARTEEHGNPFAVILEGFRLFSLRGAAIAFINAGVVYAAIMAVNFYRTMGQMKVPMLILGGIGIWILLVFLIMQLYVLPIMVLDEKRRIFMSYKKALLMTMSSPFATSTAAFLAGYFMLLLYPVMGFAFGSQIPVLLAMTALFPIFLMPFLSLAFIMIMQVNAAVLSYEKHGIYPSLKETWEERTLASAFKPWDNK